MAVAADHPGLAEAWSPTENVAWTAGIDGMGWSGPVVWGNKVFVTSVSSDADYERPKKGLYMGAGRREPSPGVHHWWVYCLDLNSGQVLWKHEAHRGEPVVPRHQKSTYAAETPAVDGQRVYALFGDLGLYCYDHAGKLLWSQAIEPKKTNYDYGAAASPVVHGDRVIMIYDNNEASYIAAYAAATGEELWKTTREEKSTWATPFVWENELRTEIVTAGKHRIRSYDLNGKLLWEMDGQMSNLIIPSPFAAHGMIYVTSGYVGDKHRPAYAIKPGASGDISLKGGATSNEFVRWYQPLAGPYNPSPIVYGDYYYTLYDKGFLTCHDAKTGELVYDKQRIAPGASFTSSPWAYNGKVFALSEDGDTYVFQAGPEYKLLGTNPLDELCLASPAVVGDRLLLRTASKVYCIRP
jgi:outer membrane protein assembly factor BamB